jgi:hypothetical protein
VIEKNMGIPPASDGNPFSRDNLSLDRFQSAPQPTPISPRPKRKEPFIPAFPVAVLDRLLGLPGKKDGYVYLILLWRSKVEGKNPVELTSARLACHGISRQEKWRALASLEQAGLVAVERRPQRNPLVTLLHEKRRP